MGLGGGSQAIRLVLQPSPTEPPLTFRQRRLLQAGAAGSGHPSSVLCIPGTWGRAELSY